MLNVNTTLVSRYATKLVAVSDNRKVIANRYYLRFFIFLSSVFENQLKIIFLRIISCNKIDIFLSEEVFQRMEKNK